MKASLSSPSMMARKAGSLFFVASLRISSGEGEWPADAGGLVFLVGGVQHPYQCALLMPDLFCVTCI